MAPARDRLAGTPDPVRRLAHHPARQDVSFPAMRAGYRSFFWPAVLITVGIVALLVSSGVISADRLYLLLNLWPVILIVIGLELLGRRAFPGTAGEVAAVLIVAVAAAGAIAYVAIAPSVP